MTLRGLAVLVLEDNLLLSMAMEDMLRALGCRVIGPAATLSEALALLREEPVDIALLDVNLNRGETCYPVADAMAAKNLPFAFVTGSAAHAIEARFAGAPILRKPFRHADVLDILIRMVSTPAEGV